MSDIANLRKFMAQALNEGAPNIRRESTNDLRNSVKVKDTSITIGGGAVDYAPYTNYKWISPRWNGKKNPNEGWINKVGLQAIQIWGSRYGYKVEVK